MTFRELFGRSTQARLLDFLTDHVGTIYLWSEIKQHVPRVTCMMINRLTKAGLIRAAIVGKKTRYRINDENSLVRAVIHSDFMRGKAAAEQETKATAMKKAGMKRRR